MKWWLYIALKQLFPTGRGISFFAAVSVLGVALGVLGLFGTQSVMNGFHSEISVKLRDTSGDIIIRDYGRPMYSLDELKARLKALPEVASVEFVAQGPVMMVANNVPIFPMLRSYDTISGDCALPIKEKNFVKMGSLDDLDDDSVIVGQRLAASAGMGVGDKVEVFSPTMLDRLKRGEVPMAASLDVAGLLATDYSQADSNVAIVSLRRMRDLYNLGEGSHSVVVRLKDEFAGEAEAFAKRLSGGGIVPRRYSVSTWLGANEAFLRVIKMEKVMMSLIIFLIILVASFSICISLYTSVLRKTREIGLSAAMGARPLQIAGTYCFQGFAIGVFGSALGLLLTVALLHFRAPIAEFIVGRDALVEFYHFARLPVKYEPADALWACGFSVVLCTLAGLLPALRAARLKASEAMRNE